MLTDKVTQKISTLSTDLAVAVSLNDPQAWEELAELCNEININLIAEAEFILSDIVSRAKGILQHLATDKPSTTDTEISYLLKLISILTTAADEKSYDQGLAREIIANTDIFLSDLQSISESSQAEEAIEIDDEFMQEIEGRIDRLESLIFKYLPTGVNDAEECRSIFREFHTLKGEAGILGLNTLSTFWHSVEEVIQDARSGKLDFTRKALDLLLQMVKFGRNLLRNSKLNPSEKTESATVLERLNAEILSPDTGSPAPATSSSVESAAPTPPSPAEEENEEEDYSYSGAEEDVSDDFFTMEPEDETDEPKARIVDTDLPPTVSEPIPEPVAEVKTVPAAPPAPAPQREMPAPAVSTTETTPALSSASVVSQSKAVESELSEVNYIEEKDVETYSLRNVQIDVKKLDQLLDIVSEVSLIGSHLLSNPEISTLASASGDLQDLMRFCRNLNDMASSFRMTPIAPLFHRIQRAANDAARAIGKQVNLVLEGQDTKVDRSIIERLSAALIHLVRNSVGHGLESASRRREFDKPPVGRLHLSAKQTGADIIIEFSDDGAGIDVEKIRNKAIANGSIAENAKLKESEIINLIFSSGFSTSDSVDGISGRGVGMAIVQESMDSLRGRIEVDNHPGEGVTFRLRFPVALAAIEALLVTLGDNIIAIPVQSVRETFKLDKNQISTVEGRGIMVNIRGIIVPLIKMSEFLGIEGKNNLENGVLILVDEGEKLAAILVDAVMETRQVVIRQLEGQLRDIPEITGCALLSDRQISLVLDTRRIIENSYIASGNAYSEAGANLAASERKVEIVTIGSNAVGIIDFIVKARKKDGSEKIHKFAINAFKTREFVPMSKLTQVPNMPDGFAGMLLLRDETIPVMSLDILLGLPVNKQRSPEYENIIIICEFAGVTIGFIVTEVNSVSYISWNDITPPPQTGSFITLNYVIGTILSSAISNSSHTTSGASNADDITFLLDFEQIVQKVIELYDNIGESLNEVQLRKDHTRILLVEDSPLIRRETARALEEHNIEVIQAGDGLEAKQELEKLYQQSQEEKKSIFNYIDLVLSDIEMPQMDGYSLTQFVKNHHDLRLLPVLLHSSLTNDTIVNRAKEVHADGFVPKCDPNKLVEHLKKYL